jgi:hypothetical protein
MRISNRQNSSLSSSSRRSADNLPLSSRCNKYSSLYNKRSPGNLHCRRVKDRYGEPERGE